ncbi:MAG: carbohydrate ABC transporter permease [Cetobacterium sp.]|uniref:carbohydrate ABC transporter permease n=1 Tax=Cetobacterium sp. TaxID=2071632 RepID=UPI003F3B8A33
MKVENTKLDSKAKSSMLMSALMMGLGQSYNKFFLKGLLLFSVEIIFFLNLGTIIPRIKGLITLGENPQKMVNFKVVQGDHSIFMMVDGAITLILLLAFIGLYIFNILDAKKCSMIPNEKQKKFKDYIYDIYDKNFIKLMLIPGALAVVFFVVLPIFITVLVAFTNYSSPNNIPPRNLVGWVGFTNFINIFKLSIWSKTFIKLGIWTMIWAVSSTILNYGCGLILALLTSRNDVKFKKLWRTIYILPYAIPAFVSLLVFRLMFSGVGPINNMITSMGLEKLPFFTDSTFAKVMLLLINTWLGAPYFMILISGALTNIDLAMYEAAEIDGATKWQQFTEITMPVLLLQTAPVLILSFAFNFNNFSAVYLLTGGGPINSEYRYAGSTDILITWVYKLTKEQSQYNIAAVISIILFIFIASISTWNFMRSKSFKEETN